MASTADTVRIRYLRLPDREDIYVQHVVHRAPGCAVTFLPATKLRRPLRVGADVILEPDAPAVWFTFEGVAHDIGRFHLADGTFTGIYANILTPVEGFEGATWRTTDLFLDVWMPVGGGARLLDVDELDAAERSGVVGPDRAAGARVEAARIMAAATAGAWPPDIVGAWPLERVRQVLAGAG